MKRILAIALAMMMLLPAVSFLSMDAGAVSETYVFVSKWGGAGADNGQFNFPNGLAVDATGNVYVADMYNSRIQKFTAGGEFITEWGGYDGTEAALAYPAGVAIGPGGDIYVTDPYDGSRRVQKYNSDGNYLATFISGTILRAPEGLAFDSAGNALISDAGYYGLLKFDSYGSLVNSWGSLGSEDGQFWFGQWGVAVAPSGAIYAVDGGNNRVQWFSSDGTFMGKWGTSGTGDGEFSSPNGIAVDSSGLVYVTDTGNNRVQVFDGNGVFQTSFGSYGSGDGLFDGPRGIAVDQSGNVYIADSGNNRIQKFAVQSTPQDTTAPTIVSVAKQTVKRSSPSMYASLSDTESGIDVSSVRISINGQDITANAVITDTGIQYSTADLSKGNNVVVVQAADLAGNAASATWTVRLVGSAR